MTCRQTSCQWFVTWAYLRQSTLGLMEDVRETGEPTQVYNRHTHTAMWLAEGTGSGGEERSGGFDMSSGSVRLDRQTDGSTLGEIFTGH